MGIWLLMGPRINDVGATQLLLVKSYSALLNKGVAEASVVALNVPDK
jgi:hypothetical protein